MAWEVSQAEAAGILDVSYRTLTNALKGCPAGKIPRHGGRVNVDLDAVIDYLAERNPGRYASTDYQSRLADMRVSQESIATMATEKPADIATAIPAAPVAKVVANPAIPIATAETEPKTDHSGMNQNQTAIMIRERDSHKNEIVLLKKTCQEQAEEIKQSHRGHWILIVGLIAMGGLAYKMACDNNVLREKNSIVTEQLHRAEKERDAEKKGRTFWEIFSGN